MVRSSRRRFQFRISSSERLTLSANTAVHRMSNARGRSQKGNLMASNFRIFVQRQGNSLHLKLTGNFDGSSAHELLNTLKRIGKGVREVFIHTACLRLVHPFGRNTFLNNLHLLGGQRVRLVLTGVYATQFLPARHLGRRDAKTACAPEEIELRSGT